MEEFVEAAGVAQVEVVEEEVVEDRPEMMCLVIGYTLNVAGETKSLLLADTIEGRTAAVCREDPG